MKTIMKVWLSAILAIIGVFGFFGITCYIIIVGIDNLSKDTLFIIGNLTGMSAAIAKEIFSFYFGSSMGSKDKTDIMNNKNN